MSWNVFTLIFGHFLVWLNAIKITTKRVSVVKTVFIVISRLLNLRFDKKPRPHTFHWMCKLYLFIAMLREMVKCKMWKFFMKNDAFMWNQFGLTHNLAGSQIIRVKSMEIQFYDIKFFCRSNEKEKRKKLSHSHIFPILYMK